MRVLVTGGAGFIGSHLVDRLVEHRHSVVILDDLSTGREENIAHLVTRSDVRLVRGSILDAELVGELAGHVDVIYHLAAAVGVELIVERPLQSLTTNIRGSEIVFEKAFEHGCRVLVTSTSEIYGKNTSDRLREDDDRVLGSPLKSRWSYSEAKAIDEILAYTYWKERGLETVIVRLFNTVGPRQTGSYGMVIPRFVEQALAGRAITVFGTGEQTRCFGYVGDVVTGMISLCDHPDAYGQVFNLGGNDEISMNDLAARIIRLTGSRSVVQHIPYDIAYEEGFEDMMRRVPDTSKAHQLVGFSASTGLDQIILEVADECRRR